MTWKLQTLRTSNGDSLMIRCIGVTVSLAGLLIGILGCEEGPKKGVKTSGKTAKNTTEACECALECAQNTMVDDPSGLEACKNECSDEFGAKAAAKGFERALGVMSQDRQSCED
jgi:hypothetical protein